MAAKLVFPELVHVFAPSSSMRRIIHRDVRRRSAALREGFIVGAVTTLQDIDLRIMNSGIDPMIHGTIFGAKVFGTEERE